MYQTLQQTLFLRLLLFFIAGIIVQMQWDLFPFWMYCFIFSVGVIGLALIPKVAYSYCRRWLFGFGTALLCISSAGILSHEAWEKAEWTAGDSQAKAYQVRIMDEPVRKKRTWMYKVQINSKKAIIYLPIDTLSSALLPSDRLEIKGQFEPVDQIYLRKQGIAARAFIHSSNWKKIEADYSKSEFNLRFQALKCRRMLLNRLRVLTADEKSFSVAAAILFGYVNELDKDLRQTFSATGSAHILSVSGLHFSIIYGILYFLFSFLGKSKKMMIIRQIIILPLMWFFAFLTGLGASVIRAAIMLTLWGIGNAFFFRPLTINTVGVAAFFMLLYNPMYLFDIGFQLSFSAVLAILWIHPHLVKLYETRNPALKYIWELSCVSTSAQLGTAPLSIYYFRQFPLVYLIANLFAVPLTGILLFLIPFSLLMQFLLGNHTWIMYPLDKLLQFFIAGLEKIEQIPHGTIDNIYLKEIDTVALILWIVFSFALIVKKRIIYLYLLIILFVLQVLASFTT